MIERTFAIKNFRNIGKNEYEKLEVNYALNPTDKMGGIVTLIGMNNSGKSNFLDAIRFFNSKALSPNDTPIFMDTDESMEPIVTMWIKDTVKEIEYQVKVKDKNSYLEKYVKNKIEKKPSTQFKYSTDQNANLAAIKTMIASGTQMGHGSLFSLISPLLTKLENSTISFIELRQLHGLISHANFTQSLRNIGLYSPVTLSAFTTYLNREVSNLSDEGYDLTVTNELENDYGLSAFPKIIYYDDKDKIDFTSTVSIVTNGKLQKPEFFKVLFKLFTKTKYENLENAYTKFHASKGTSKFLLNNFKEGVQDDLAALSRSFNKIYGYFDDNHYEFKLDFDRDQVYFILRENGMDVDLQNQSTGFKWFFNFFFKVFAKEDFKNGDIVIMDEPATNLHVRGQIELRKQLKQFGLEQGITFIISTHSPFFIDVDYLDEIRIVTKDSHISKVENKFTVINGHKVDVLLPIHASLTVERHIVLNPNDITIFVEGITDYNYLVAFKHLFKFSNISFLPVQGIKNNKLGRQLHEITKSPIILIDSDEAGIKFYDANVSSNVLEIRRLSDIDPKFIEIEDLFSANDKQQYIDKKNYKLSCYFKDNIHKIKLEPVTIDNFTKLFKDLRS